jgi:general secretion pathway protein A
MYNEFYGFSEKPFEVTPDPRFLYLTPSHREALDSMIDGIKNRRGFISITGEAGTGKTTLIHSLLNSLGEKVKTIYIFHSTITFKELLKTILSELDLGVGEESEPAFLYRLVKYLTQMGADETLAIIIDEAQNLAEEVMQELQMFSDLEAKAIQVVLVGQPESQGLSQFKQRIRIKHQIRALTGEESMDYIDRRLRLVGRSSSQMFTPKALSMICSYVQGIPRIINILCDNAFLMGYNLSQKKIDVDIIREVIKDIEGPSLQKTILSSITTALREFRPSPIRLKLSPKKVSLAILSLICLGGLILLTQGYLQQRPTNTWKIESLKSLKLPQPVTLPLASAPSTRELDKLKEVVTVEEGQTLYYIAQKYYHIASTTLIDLILDCNPEITNANLIISNQKIKISKITEELLILQDTDHTYKIHVGTFQNSSFVRFYRNEPVLKGKVVEIFPRKVSPQETWYRVVVGPFGHKDECLKVIAQLKEKGLLPVFWGILKME